MTLTESDRCYRCDALAMFNCDTALCEKQMCYRHASRVEGKDLCEECADAAAEA